MQEVHQPGRLSAAYSYAGFLIRLQAFLWDYSVLLGYIILLVVVSMGFPQIQSYFQGPVQSDLMAFLVLILPSILYFTVQESGERQGSLGKQKRGLRVIRLNGRRVGWGRAFWRSCIAFLPWQLGHTAVFHSIQPGPFPPPLVWTLFALSYGLVALGGLMIWKGEAHRAPWDILAGTLVVKTMREP